MRSLIRFFEVRIRRMTSNNKTVSRQKSEKGLGNTANFMPSEAKSNLLAPNFDRSLRVIVLKLNCTVDVFFVRTKKHSP